MTDPIPPHPKIYHITHIQNLAQIAASGKLWSDAQRIEQNLTCSLVGMKTIKQRRLDELFVSCHPGKTVGQFVPFYFCPRSIMLFILHRGNHADVTYRDGQQCLVHLQADLHRVVNWANEQNRPWAFTPSNAGARYTMFYNSLEELGQINWTAVKATDFRHPDIKEGKQAEFLVYRSFPWSLVEKVGVITAGMRQQVEACLAEAAHAPPVRVEPSWYF